MYIDAKKSGSIERRLTMSIAITFAIFRNLQNIPPQIFQQPNDKSSTAKMPKAEFGSTKQLNNQLKSKGLQRLRWYCQVRLSPLPPFKARTNPPLPLGLRKAMPRRKRLQDAHTIRIARTQHAARGGRLQEIHPKLQLAVPTGFPTAAAHVARRETRASESLLPGVYQQQGTCAHELDEVAESD